MSKSNALENDILDLLFNATAIADLAENDSSSPATSLTWALHTSDPGEAGDQANNEAGYTSYARKAETRNSGGHTITGSSMSPTGNVDFVTASGGGETETHFSIGPDAAGDYMMYFGTVTPNIAVSNGVTPRLTTASTVTED